MEISKRIVEIVELPIIFSVHGKSAGAPESDRFVEAEEVEEGAEPVLQPWAFSEGLAAWSSAKGGLA
jgi:hypothetical protein